METDGVFVDGFADKASRRANSGCGVGIAWFDHGGTGANEHRSVNPEDAFFAAVTLSTHRADVRHGRSVVRSGPLPRGCVQLSEPSEIITTRAEGAWELMFFVLPLPAVSAVLDACDLPARVQGLGFVNGAARSNPSLLHLARRARRAVMGADPFAKLTLDLLAQELVVDLLQNHSSIGDLARRRSADPVGGLSPHKLQRACEMLAGSVEDGISLAELALAAGCSPSHFSRAFKQSTGMPPFAWLLHERVERAKSRMLDPRTSLAEIALAVGFAAQPQFTSAFKRVTGMTPGVWRRMRQS